jgi:hypothetical protein
MWIFVTRSAELKRWITVTAPVFTAPTTPSRRVEDRLLGPVPARRANIRVWFRPNGGESRRKIYYRRFKRPASAVLFGTREWEAGLKFPCSGRPEK